MTNKKYRPILGGYDDESLDDDFDYEEGLLDLETMEKHDPDEGFDEDEPQEDDAFLSSSGQLGGRTSVSVDGKFLGEFNSDEEAVEALKEWMEKNQYWPGVWYVSDHGNINPFTLD